MRALTILLLTILLAVPAAWGGFDVVGIDDSFYFYATTTNRTGHAADADSVPTYRCYESETGTNLSTGSMAKLDDAGTLGYYSESFIVSATHYTAGNFYSCFITATVAGTVGTTHREFYVTASGHSLEEIADNIDDIETDTGTTLDNFLDTEIASILADTSALVVNTSAILTDTGTTLDDFLDTEIASILADTAGMVVNTSAILVDTGTTLDGIVDSILVDTAAQDTAGEWDTLMATALGYIDTEIAAILADTGAMIVNVSAIQAKTTNLPTDPADDSDIDAQLLAIDNYVDTEVASTLADTEAMIVNVSAILTDTGTTLPASIGTVNQSIATTAEVAAVTTAVNTVNQSIAMTAELLDTEADIKTVGDANWTTGGAADLDATNALIKGVNSTVLTVNQSITTSAELAAIDTKIDSILADTAAMIINLSAVLLDTGTTLDDLLDTEIASILADTAALILNVTAILTDTGTTLPASIGTVNQSIATTAEVAAVTTAVNTVNQSIATTVEVASVNQSIATTSEVAAVTTAVNTVNQSIAMTAELLDVEADIKAEGAANWTGSSGVTIVDIMSNMSTNHGTGNYNASSSSSVDYERIKDAVRKASLDRYDKRASYNYDGLGRVSSVIWRYTNASDWNSPEFNYTETFIYTGVYNLDYVTTTNNTARW